MPSDIAGYDIKVCFSWRFKIIDYWSTAWVIEVWSWRASHCSRSSWSSFLQKQSSIIRYKPQQLVDEFHQINSHSTMHELDKCLITQYYIITFYVPFYYNWLSDLIIQYYILTSKMQIQNKIVSHYPSTFVLTGPMILPMSSWGVLTWWTKCVSMIQTRGWAKEMIKGVGCIYMVVVMEEGVLWWLLTSSSPIQITSVLPIEVLSLLGLTIFQL